MQIVIVGNGISGITAARYLRKHRNHRILLVSNESAHFFSRPALMYVFMRQMRFEHLKPYEDWFWEKNRLELLQAEAVGVDTAAQTLQLADGRTLPYDALIIASGSRPNVLGVAGESLGGVRGFYSLQDLQYLENEFAIPQKIRHATVVGGGLIGVELAEMFCARGAQVRMLVRDAGYWRSTLPAEESALVDAHIRAQGVDLQLNTEVAALEGEQRVQALELRDGRRLATDFVGVAVGVSPQVGWLRGSGIETQRGVLVDAYLRASAPNVYAIGDCAELRAPEPGRRAVESVWYTGQQMGELAAYNLCAKTPLPYRPRLWFNSAKFFALEYQTYGYVPADPVPTLDSRFWAAADGRRALRVVFEKTDNHAVVGFNALGVRLRHEVCERWILDKTPLEVVLRELQRAEFGEKLRL